MAERKLLPWKKMWDYIGVCGESPNLDEMLRRSVREFPRLIPCEHAMTCVAAVDPSRGSLSVHVEHNGVSESVVVAYCQHYFREDIARLDVGPSSLTIQMDWRQAKLAKNAFVRDFIHGLLRIDFSAGIPIVNRDGSGAAIFMFTRIGTGRMSGREGAILLALRPHLVNLYSLFKRIECLPADHLFAAELARESELLSKREAEIAGLLCRRLHAHEIAASLMISKRTVETHVQHIYDKLRVNSRVDLLHRLMG